MFSPFLLRLRAPPRVPLHMPRLAKVTTGMIEVAPRRSGRTRTVVNYASQAATEGEPIDLGAGSPLTDLESEETTEPPPKKKQRRRVKVVEPVVYDIPPVETKTTTFEGTNQVSMSTLARAYKGPTRSFGIRTFHNSNSLVRHFDRTSARLV